MKANGSGNLAANNERLPMSDTTPNTEPTAAQADRVVIATPSDLPFPMSLVVQLVHYCVWNNPQTQDMKCGEIKAAIGVLFDAGMVEEALSLLRGESR